MISRVFIFKVNFLIIFNKLKKNLEEKDMPQPNSSGGWKQFLNLSQYFMLLTYFSMRKYITSENKVAFLSDLLCKTTCAEPLDLD